MTTIAHICLVALLSGQAGPALDDPGAPGGSANLTVAALTQIGDFSLRGVAQRGEKIVWISGSAGTVRRSDDGGGSWKDVAPKGSEELDFRDIALLEDEVVLLMSAGPGSASRVYKTVDGGASWRLTLENRDDGAFFNGFDFWDSKQGLLTSDSTDGRLLLLRTEDAGETWHRVGKPSLPALGEGEAGFAASGTGVVTLGQKAWIATGGAAARVFHSGDRGSTWAVFETPMVSGKASTGIFSISFADEARGVIVGGDYRDPQTDEGNAAWSSDGGRSWQRSLSETPIEQKACVRFLGEELVFAAGRSGLILSRDAGRSWQPLDGPPFYSFDFDPESQTGYLVGSEGRIGRFRVR